MNPTPPYVRISILLNGELLQQSTHPANQSVVIGRGSECQIVLDNPGVSRTHAELICTDNGIEVADLNSGNGTFINGKAIDKSLLQSGDTLRVGKFTVRALQTDQVAESAPLPAGEDSASPNDAHKTVFLRPEERQKILQQSSAPKFSAITKPTERYATKSHSNNPWVVFTAGIIVGTLICGLVLLIR